MNEIITKDASGALRKVYAPPAGEIMLFAGDTVPDGWLPCTGALVSRSAYPELFAAIGEKYGAGDGNTNFALPDTSDRFPRFAGNGLTVGETQEDTIRDITGSFAAPYGNVSGAFQNATSEIGAFARGSEGIFTKNFAASTVVPTATENRPKAIAFKACIKY